jgi:hypothetical protein
VDRGGAKVKLHIDASKTEPGQSTIRWLHWLVALCFVINAGTWLHQLAIELFAAISLAIAGVSWFYFRRRVDLKLIFTIALVAFLFYVPLLYMKQPTTMVVMRSTLGVLLISLLMSYKISHLQKIVYAYSMIVLGLGITSLVFWAADNTANIMEAFPVYILKEALPFPYYNAFVYTRSSVFAESYKLGIFRNAGVFWEPGVLAVNTVLAASYIVFFVRQTKYLLISLAVLITTLSTTAYICVVLMLAMMITVFRSKRVLRGLIAASVAASVLFVVYPESFNIINQTLFEKLQFDSDVSGSLSLRSNNAQNALNQVLSSPAVFLFGHGRTNEVDIESGIVQLLHQNGVLFTLSYLVLILVVFKKYMGWLGAAMILVCLNSQPVVYFPHVLLFVAIGFNLIRFSPRPKLSLQPLNVTRRTTI